MVSWNQIQKSWSFFCQMMTTINQYRQILNIHQIGIGILRTIQKRFIPIQMLLLWIDYKLIIYLPMSKSLFVVLIALFVMSATAHSVDEMKKAFRNDKCISNEIDSIKPMIEEKIAALKLNKENAEAKVELISLVRDLKAKFDSCGNSNKIQPQLGDAVEAAGISFLLASNCFKDVGAVLLIADDVIQDPSSIAEDIIVAIFVGILGLQGYKDCKQFINFVIG